MLLTRPSSLVDLDWTSYCITSIIASWYCVTQFKVCSSVCADVCGVKCVSIRVVRISRQLQKCSSLAGCVQAACGFEPWSCGPVVPLPAKAEARIRDGGEAYHGSLLYLDWQTNSSFTQVLFTKGSRPHLWESCL